MRARGLGCVQDWTGNKENKSLVLETEVQSSEDSEGKLRYTYTASLRKNHRMSS